MCTEFRQLSQHDWILRQCNNIRGNGMHCDDVPVKLAIVERHVLMLTNVRLIPHADYILSVSMKSVLFNASALKVFESCRMEPVKTLTIVRRTVMNVIATQGVPTK